MFCEFCACEYSLSNLAQVATDKTKNQAQKAKNKNR